MNPPSIPFEQQVERAAGLDIHKVEIVATISGVGIITETRDFKSTTSSLTEIERLVISERHYPCSDGKYRCLLETFCNILEPGGFTILVVNARHIKYVPGHKTDKKGSAWICKLLRADLLKGSFIPRVEQRRLRDLTRYRRKLVQQQSAKTNRMIRVFEDANLKLSSVFSNVHGKTCSTVIEAILSGRTDADYLSSLCTYRSLKCTQEEIRAAVEGRFTEHPKFMLEVIRENIDHLEVQINTLDKRIDELVAPIGDEIVRIAEIPGMGEMSAKEF